MKEFFHRCLEFEIQSQVYFFLFVLFFLGFFFQFTAFQMSNELTLIHIVDSENHVQYSEC